jgi:GR25 family glycosyltransferase involved in LPS biosynthesis
MNYTIIYVNDRALENRQKINSILCDFNYVDDIEFCNGNTSAPWHIIDNMGIRQDVWSPYDGRSFSPLPGELGIWVSTLNVFKYIVDNSIDKFLILEDDAILSENFVKYFEIAIKDLPEDFDFLSLSYFQDQNEIDSRTQIGSEHIHKSYNQYSNGVGMVYSLKGAKKVLKLLKRTGIEYTSDCYLFHYSQNNTLNGYSLIKKESPLVSHMHSKIKSLIDPENIRETDNDL